MSARRTPTAATVNTKNRVLRPLSPSKAFLRLGVCHERHTESLSLFFFFIIYCNEATY